MTEAEHARKGSRRRRPYRPSRRDQITWVSFSPNNVQETGVSPVDGLNPAWWPRRRSRSSELEEGPGHRPNSRFLCPSGTAHA
jgi:hypothetical protein